MDCYECAVQQEAVAAVAICPNCGVAMCLEHLRHAQAHRAGGLMYGCSHDLGAGAPKRPTSRGGGRPNGHLRVQLGTAS